MINYLLLLSLLFISCNSKSKVNSDEIIAADDRFLPIYYWKKEYLKFDSALINNKISLKCSSDEIIKTLGYPTKVNPFKNVNYLSCRSFADSLYYYDNTIFYKYEDEITPCVIDFNTTPLEIFYPGITLSKNTKIEEIGQVFPLSYRLKRGEGKNWEGYVQLNTTNQEWQEKVCFLIFSNGKLSKIVMYHTPNDYGDIE